MIMKKLIKQKKSVNFKIIGTSNKIVELNKIKSLSEANFKSNIVNLLITS